MATVNKSYLDFNGLQTYDNNIKQTISDVEEQIPAISVNTTTKTLVIDFVTPSNNSGNQNG